ncbi:MAG: hypothetical protein H6671_15480 [Anaerolineaceae bacterium]|nr:hypothetical protein [Anaerolineaceae bacterium]
MVFDVTEKDEWDVDPEPAQLMAVLKSTEADLLVNQNGQLSAGQCHRLQDEHDLWRWVRYAGWIGLPLAISRAVWDGIRVGDSASSRIAIITLIVVIFLVWSVFAEVKLRRVRADLTEGVVKVVEGPVRLFIYHSRQYGVHYQVIIGNLKLQISGHLYRLLRQNVRYAIYYTPRTKHILTVEKLNDCRLLTTEN